MKTFAILLIMVITAQAAEPALRLGPAPLPQDFSSPALWPAAVSYQAYKDHDMALDFKVFMLSMASNHRVNLDETLRAVNQVNKQYEELRAKAGGGWKPSEAYQEIGEIALSVALTKVPDPSVKALLAGFGKIAIKEGVKAYQGYRAPLEQIAAQKELTQFSDRAGPIDRTVRLFGLQEAAKSDPQLREALKITLGSDPLADSHELAAKYPEFTQNRMVAELWNEIVASGRLDNAEKTQTMLLDKFKALLARVNEGIATERADITALNAKVTEVISNAKSLEERRQALEKLAREQAEARARRELEQAQGQLIQQLTPDAARGAIYLLSTFAGFHNPKLAQSIQGVGENVVRMYEAMQKFEAVLSNPAVTGAAEALAGAALTGNIMSGMFGIMSALNGQKTPTEVLSEQLSKLHEELNAMHREMHKRFDHIDKMIAIFYEQTMKGFGQIIDQLNTMSVDTAQIQRNVEFALLAMQRLERNTSENFRAIYHISFDSSYLDCVNWTQAETSSPGKAPGLDTFERCLRDFRKFATVFAPSHLSVVEKPSASTLDFGAVHRELTTGSAEAGLELTPAPLPVESYVNQLASYATMLDQNFQPQPALANPYEWAAGVEAYLQTLLAYPQAYLRVVDITAPVSSMRSMGTALEGFARQLRRSEVDHSTGKVKSLFHSLLDAYDQRVDLLAQNLNAQKTNLSERMLGGEDLLRNYEKTKLQIKLPESIPPCAQIHPEADKDFSLSPLPESLAAKLGDVAREAMATGAIETSFCYSMDDSERVHHRETREVKESNLGSYKSPVGLAIVGGIIAGPIGAIGGFLFGKSDDRIRFVEEWETTHIKYRIKGYYNKYPAPLPGSSHRGDPTKTLIFSHVVTDATEVTPVFKTHTYRNLDDHEKEFKCGDNSCDRTSEVNNYMRSAQIRGTWAGGPRPIRAQFDSGSVAEEVATVEANLAVLGNDVGSRIGATRRAFYTSVLGDGMIATSQSEWAIASRKLLNELSGVTDLLRAYATLGLHAELLSNQELREMLLGPAVLIDEKTYQPRLNPMRLVDGAYYREALMAARNAAENDQVASDAIGLAAKLKERSKALRGVLDRTLTNLEPGVTFPVVTDTLKRLHLAEKLQAASRPKRDINAAGVEALERVRAKLFK